jgi:hypothetical protein
MTAAEKIKLQTRKYQADLQHYRDELADVCIN